MKKSGTCNCCDGISVETPRSIHNRSGLQAISYRIGTHKDFKESLLAKLSTADKVTLQKLTTRREDDFTIALLDAWSMVSDVLTFYQERIANESYLQTANDELSIVQLARLIGYELRPGVAASTYLAFLVEENSLAANQALVSGIASTREEDPPLRIAPRTKVQSIPEQDEDPQTFETIESILAKPEWNVIRPRSSAPQVNILSRGNLFLKGMANNLKKGNVILIKEGKEERLKKIKEVVLDEAANRTEIRFAAVPANDINIASDFTYNVADYNLFVATNSLALQIGNIAGQGWSNGDLLSLADNQDWSKKSIQAGLNRRRGSFQANRPVNVEEPDGVFVFRQRAAVFGYNAPKNMTCNSTTRQPNYPAIWVEWGHQEQTDKIYLDIPYEEILPNTYIAIQQGNQILNEASVEVVNAIENRARTEYGISGKTTELTLASSVANWWGGNDITSLREISIHAQSEALELAEAPIKTPIRRNIIQLDQTYLELTKGKTIILVGTRNDEEGGMNSEVCIIQEAISGNGYTTITLDRNLEYSYIRSTVTINANVALATHGESVEEVLGNGDASQIFQKFFLKQNPLTYISADSPTGTASTLEIRVNDILWKEVPSLYARGATERIYITRQNSQGQTQLSFGDGITGARLPTGQQNIRAKYRRGIGASGMLQANQLSMLLSRPLGVKGVTNPLAPAGAQDREHLSDARANANLTMFTLGRIVSLQDYEDFARAFAGIRKARAIWAWYGRSRVVHLTIAGENGDTVATNSTLYENLLSAIQKNSIPNVKLVVENYRERPFRIKANISVHPDYIADKVLAAVQMKLKHDFSFEQRDFGQSVSLSQLSATISSIEGIINVDVDALYFTQDTDIVQSNPTEDTTAVRNNSLLANTARSGAETPLAADLLTLDLRSGDVQLNGGQ